MTTPAPLAAIVLAAGQGTRMKSDRHKVLHPIAGRAMLDHLLETVDALGPERKVVVVGAGREQVEPVAAARGAGVVVQDPQLGLDYSRVVHGDQKFAYTRPVRAGDRLTVTSTIDAIKSLAGNDILDVRGEVHDEAGEHVATTWMKLVARAAEEA